VTDAPGFQIRYLTHGGEILLSLPMPTTLLTFTPAQARENAELLCKLADELEPKDARRVATKLAS